jgi:alcohol dehydrogenase, propanol-preferring
VVRAYRLTEWQKPPELTEVPVPEPGPGEVLIKVGGAGLCHSDLHLMDWPPGLMPFDPPFTLGHENAGWVETLGPGVSGLEAGEPVAVYGPWGCGRCRACRLSREDYCERQLEIGTFGGGLGLDGGMADYMLVPSPRLLLPLGDLDPRDAAPLSDAALTPYHAIKRSLPKLVPGATAVVIGVGGLGQMAVQIIKATSPAAVIAVDTSKEKLDRAAALGADHTLLPEDATEETVRGIAGGRGAEVVLDVVGAEETLALAQAVLAFEGDLTLLGLAGGTIEYGFGSLPWGARIATTYWGTAVELMEVLDLARTGQIEVGTERVPLEDVADAYDRLREGRVEGRAVACPGG